MLRSAFVLMVCVVCLAGGMTGCRSPRGADVYAGVTSGVAPAYPLAFERAKDRLRELGFELDRIDARAGVITTRPRIGSGLATPWVPTEHGVSDLAHRNRRVATVRFAAANGPPAEDLRDHAGAVDVECSVEVQRVYVPGRRPSPTSVRLGGSWRDTALPSVDNQTRYATIVDTDEEMAHRIIRGVLDTP